MDRESNERVHAPLTYPFRSAPGKEGVFSGRLFIFEAMRIINNNQLLLLCCYLPVQLFTYCRTGFDSDSLTAAKIATNTHYFVCMLLLDCYNFYFFTLLKETLTFLSLSNLVLQYLNVEYMQVSGER